MEYFAKGLFSEQNYDVQRELSNRERERVWKHIDARRIALRSKIVKHIRQRRAEAHTEVAKRGKFIRDNIEYMEVAMAVWNMFHPDTQFDDKNN